MMWQDYIEVRPDVALGKPVFKGTRLTVEFVFERQEMEQRLMILSRTTWA